MIWLRSLASFVQDVLLAAAAVIGRAHDEPACGCDDCTSGEPWLCDDCCQDITTAETELSETPIWDAFTAERFRESLTDDRLRRFLEEDTA